MLPMTNRLADAGLLLMRAGLGIMFILHGYPKLVGGTKVWTGLATGVGLTVVPVFWGFMAAIAETFGGLLLALGFLFRPATVLLIGVMAGATAFHLRKGDAFVAYSRPIELMIVFVGLFLTGPGKYALSPFQRPTASVKPHPTPPGPKPADR